ncbi:YidB family protein [Bradyrhizobium sp. LHD-71]|uniref:YidB family protein n=1 Tax=Bradyrhizobium sp. LHD-71 TaxID=3072141 RepID=UPI00280CE634|nr:YidB family protein [Bradyrhizobium sp. LHD-71]MDQ8726684.1 YidB family protein [Bradyrhizobium sp. LHD-71]
MGLLDDVMGNATPGGNIAKPLMIALGTLVLSKMMSGGAAAQKSDPTLVPEQGAGTPANADGGLLGGLEGMLNKLQTAGHGETVNSWVGSGQNKPIQPNQLGQALGPKAVSTAAQQAGMSEQQLLSQLAAALPGVVDKLTANGKIPTLQELASAFTQQQQK